MTEIDGIRTWSYVHKNKVIHKISEKYVKGCRRKVRKTVTDGRRPGRTDGHHHTIIRPVWRRAYKNFKEWEKYFRKVLIYRSLGVTSTCMRSRLICGYLGAFNNVAASLAASLDSSSSIERISRKARLAKMASVAKVVLIFVVCCV